MATRGAIIITTCDQCGTAFERRGCKVRYARKRGQGVFCSRNCVQASLRIEAIVLRCVVCGESFVRDRCRVAVSERKHQASCCSHRCSMRYRRWQKSRRTTGPFAYGLPIYQKDGGGMRAAYDCICGRDGKPLWLHHIVWEHAHGIPVPVGCVVHHSNGDPLDNRPGNLVAVTPRNHRRAHAGWEITNDGECVGRNCSKCGQYKQMDGFPPKGSVCKRCQTMRKNKQKKSRRMAA